MIFFICTNRINRLNLKKSSNRIVIVTKGFLKMPILHMVIKQEFITSQKLGPQVFWWIANSIFKKDKSAIPPPFNFPEVLSSASDKAKLFAKKFSKNPNRDGSGMSLSIFPSRTNLNLHNIYVTPKMAKKAIANLDSSKASGPDSIPEMVLKNCESELSYILAELFNMSLKEPCFPDC